MFRVQFETFQYNMILWYITVARPQGVSLPAAGPEFMKIFPPLGFGFQLAQIPNCRPATVGKFWSEKIARNSERIVFFKNVLRLPR
jgi:hypothetical protein